MAIRLGSGTPSTFRLGSQSVSKLMLGSTQLWVPAGGGGNISLIGATIDGGVYGTTTGVTISAIGDTAGTKIIGIAWGGAPAPALAASEPLTVDGVVATLLGSAINTNNGVALFSVVVSQGAAGVISLDTQGNNGRLGAWAWDSNGRTPGTPVTDITNNLSRTLQLSNASGASVIALANGYGGSSNPASYTGVTKHTGTGEEGLGIDSAYYMSAALANNVAANLGVGITYSETPYAATIAIPLE